MPIPVSPTLNRLAYPIQRPLSQINPRRAANVSVRPAGSTCCPPFYFSSVIDVSRTGSWP
jgi:hypothetical protein